MQRIALLTCMKSVTDNCTGAACMKAFYSRTGAFAQYQAESMELAAFFCCNGCGGELSQDAGLQEKVDRILAIHPDAVHLGVCTLKKDTGERCGVIAQLADTFLENGIRVVNGTHSSPRLQDIGKSLEPSSK